MTAFASSRTIVGNDTPTTADDRGMIIVNGTATITLNATGWTAGTSAVGFLVLSGTATFAGSGATVSNQVSDLVQATALTYVVAHYRASGEWVVTGTETPYLVGGTDVALADGGTGASTVDGARRNLGAMGPVFDVTAYANPEAAHTALKAADGGILFFPPGDHTIATGLTHDTRDANDGPLTIVAWGATITYTGSGTMLQLSCPTAAASGWEPTHILGGRWLDGGTGVTGFQLRDIRSARIESADITGFSSACIELFNDYAWCELNHITSCGLSADRHAIYFNPQSVNLSGNGGTESFARTRITNCRVGGGEATYSLIHCQGGVYDSSIRDVGGNVALTVAAHFIHVEGSMGGTVIDGIGIEFGAAGSALFDVGVFGGLPPTVGAYRAASPIVTYSAASKGSLPSAGVRGINQQGGATYTFTPEDARRVIRVTSGVTQQALTAPPNSDVAFTIGTVLRVNAQNSGGATLVAGAGVTLRGSLAITQNETIEARKIFTDTWDCSIFAKPMVIGTDVAAPSATWTWRSVDSKSGAAYDVVADDVGRLIRMTTAHDVNIPNTLGMATGSQFGILLTGATGNVTDGSSVVLNGAAAGAGSFAMTAHQIIVCTVLAADTYNVSGV